MTAVLRPSCAARIAATYPPGPAPRTTTLKCVLMPRTILRRAGHRARGSDGERHHRVGGGGVTTPGRSAQVIVFGSSHGPSHDSAARPPSLPPRSVSVNSEPAGVKWNDPQLLTPTAPTLRASTFAKDAEPAARALTTDVPVPSTRTSRKWTLLIE